MQSEIKLLTAATMRVREVTGASMLSCKYALQTAGSHDDAIKFLFIAGACNKNSRHPIILNSSKKEISNSLSMKVREFTMVPPLQAKRALQVSDGDLNNAVSLLMRASSSFEGQIDILRFANEKREPVVKIYEDELTGSHLVSPRGIYEHHGIYAGHGKVIHYGGLADEVSSAPIEEVSIGNFSKGSDVFVKIHDQPAFSPSEVLMRARSRLGENTYSVFLNNCEHFCNWCIEDKHKSHQIDDLTKKVFSIGGGSFIVAGTTGAAPVIGLVMTGLGFYKIINGLMT